MPSRKQAIMSFCTMQEVLGAVVVFPGTSLIHGSVSRTFQVCHHLRLLTGSLTGVTNCRCCHLCIHTTYRQPSSDSTLGHLLRR